MTEPPNILRVAVPRPLFQLLDYLPANLVTTKPVTSKKDILITIPKAGCRVRIPFGHTEITGVVVEVVNNSTHDELKPILEILDTEPLLDSQTLKLLMWASQYYHHPIGDVITHAIPLALRGQRKVPKTPVWVTKTTQAPPNLTKAPKQQAVYEAILQSKTEGINEVALQAELGKNTKAHIRQLEKKSLIQIKKEAFYFSSNLNINDKPDKHTLPDNKPSPLTLTQEQQDCIIQICTPKPYLLHGVTGSGKTEVYLRVIEPLLAAGQQILILVPEIGLTPQLLQRFTEFFNTGDKQKTMNIAVMHSKLSDGERMKAWLAAKTGQVDILIGTRSAVFVPMPKLGMIIIDEEHDSSLKQQEGFRYHARDLAVKRAHELDIPIVLGSATPSLESLHNSHLGRYHYLHLSQRPGTRSRPSVLVQDIRGLLLESGICPPLLSTIREHIKAGNQVLLFLNRRGFAPALLCPKCGWHATCPHCDSNMTYHAHSHKLICHRCDYDRAVDNHCPECKNPQITTRGQGTERIEQKLQTHFPDTRIIRVDRDTTRRKGELQKKLDQVNLGAPAILIGTQMLAKGHDFPNLTLVGILDVDQSLFSTDFRAWERLSQLIIQVAGRAGRAKKKGTVMLQTTQPDHPFFHILLSQGYLAIAEQSLSERKSWSFPPYAYQALIRANATRKEHALNYLHEIKKQLLVYQSSDFILLGPAPSPIEKRANRYRTQLLLTAMTRKQLHQALHTLTHNSKGIRKTGGIRWSVDVDPIDYS